ncbi:MAG TPA: CHAT domain-containing tetratricopeptide repeat protein [Candidatus Saccharimonadales bacterium]|nr:CHAT domain-containing tetratricopeptide repeat protein [Candidatus Saccharimonadales bacterium]
MWRFRILNAQVLVIKREYRKALEMLREDLPASLSSSEVAARKNMVEGVSYRFAGQYEQSRKKFEEAEQLALKVQPRLLGEILNNRGALEAEKQEYAIAEKTFRRAATLARQQNDQVQEASALGNLGRVATNQEHYDEAIDWNQSALTLSRTLGAKDIESAILGNMGWSYFDLGDFPNALDLYNQAANDAGKRNQTGYRAFWLIGVANSYFAQRDYKSAEAALQQSLNLARGLDEKDTLIDCLNSLSAVAMETGRTELAVSYNEESKALLKAGLTNSGKLETRLVEARTQGARKQFDQAERLFREVIADPSAEKPQRWEAQARLAKTYDDEGKINLAENEYKNAISTIESARNTLNRDEFRLTFFSSSIEFYEDYVDFLIADGRSGDALQIAELSRARTLAEGLGQPDKSPNSGKTAALAKQLATRLKATFLYYWVGQKQSYVWVISPGKMSYVKLPKASEIDPLVNTYRETVLTSRNVGDGSNEEGKKLYTLLVEPAQKATSLGSRVIVFPSGNLYQLNFETLIVPGSQPHYWIEDVTLSTASSLTLMGTTSASPKPQQKILLVGSTVQPNSDFPPLRQAPEEMREIEKYFQTTQITTLQGNAATPAAYLASNPGQFSYLHFVTHGTASRTRPLESAVVLSKEPDSDSYKLYARDIVQHRLNAKLVTISACNGSGTRAYSGEGLVGLSWAFLRAGAHNVIGALWEVSDASTPRLMNDLYAGLAAGKDPAAALRDAKLAMLNSKDVYRKPFYWAPFQFYSGS